MVDTIEFLLAELDFLFRNGTDSDRCAEIEKEVAELESIGSRWG